MYDDIISRAQTEYSSRTGNKTKAIKDLLYVVGKLQAEIEALKSPAKPAPKKPAPKKPAAKKPAAKKSTAKKNV